MARGRKPSVRYWASKGAYCCEIAGVQHVLGVGPDDAPTGPTYLAAVQKYARLVGMNTNQGSDSYLVSALFNQYRLHLAGSKSREVCSTFDSLTRSFVETFGTRTVGGLVPHEFEKWLTEQRQWNATSKQSAGKSIMATINWGRRKGHCQTNPLSGRVDLPRPVMRGRDARMSTELMDLLASEAGAWRTPHAGQLLLMLRRTGARPIEIASAEAANFSRLGKGGLLVYRWNTNQGYIHKTATKTQRDRTIYLGEEMAVYVETLVKKYPSGRLFRTTRGKVWSKSNILKMWARLLARPAIIKYIQAHGLEAKQIVPYNYRHTFISAYLDETGDIYSVAQICGTSVAMIEKRYGHPDVERVHARYMAFSGV